MTFAEHSAVLAALETIARAEGIAVADLLRRCARQLIAQQADGPLAEQIQAAVTGQAPQMPEVFRSSAKVAQIKREQREYALLLQELNIAKGEDLQRNNSLSESPQTVRLVSFG